MSDVAVASSPYDVISRNKWDMDIRVCNETEHTTGMVALCDAEEGVAVLNRGVYGYEHLQQEQGVLTFPIVRATGYISGGSEIDDDAWKTPENQCLRKLECELAIMPLNKERFEENALFAANAYQNPLLAQSEPVDTRKFLGGRAAVQDTEVAEIFYQELPYQEVEMECAESLLGLEGNGLQVAALKKSFDRTGYIFRFFNTKEESVNAILDLKKLHINAVYKSNFKETLRKKLELTDQQVTMCVKPKEIISLFLEK